uniref:Uncharacterized protein n=1 Tax=Arundo donax TaxID=35708 RepID=A0A0A9GQU5_ARUDO
MPRRQGGSLSMVMCSGVRSMLNSCVCTWAQAYSSLECCL